MLKSLKRLLIGEPKYRACYHVGSYKVRGPWVETRVEAYDAINSWINMGFPYAMFVETKRSRRL